MFDFKLTSIGILIECTLDCVNMAKVKFASNQEHEFINNWKILQKAFKNAGVDKVKFILPFFLFLNSLLQHDVNSFHAYFRHVSRAVEHLNRIMN